MKSKKWSKEERDFAIQHYPMYGIVWCAESLKRTTSAIRRIVWQSSLKSRRIKRIYHKELLEPIIKESYCMADILRKLSMCVNGSNHETIKKYIQLYDLDINHFDPKRIRREKLAQNINKKTLEEILVKNSNYGSTHLKERLYKAGLKKRKCELCNQGEKWKGKRMSLILDHKDGDHNNNELSNLQIVCPNCNATLDTHCRGNKRKRK